MAEERLIDDDENKKYRLKRNADGEQELVKDDSVQDTPVQEEEAVFEVEEDDEEAALLTPEQYAKKREMEQREREERERKLDGLLEAAKDDIAQGKNSTALEYLLQAEEYGEKLDIINELRMRAYTRNFTDMSAINEAAKCAEKVKQHCTGEQKAQMRSAAGNILSSNIERLNAQIASLDEENDKGKAERAKVFIKDRNKALILFGCLFAAAIVFIALCIRFALIIRTVPTNQYLILTCVFGGIAALFLIASAFAGRYLSTTWRRVILNKRDSSTALGRQLISMREELASFISVKECLEEEQ